MFILRNAVNEEDDVLVASLFLRNLIFKENQMHVFLKDVANFFALRD